MNSGRAGGEILSVSVCYVAVRTIVLSRHGGGGGVVGERSPAYEDCSSLALNAAGEGANFTSTFKMFQSLTVLL